jgi:uncharacterized RmlC-like cupin family protein
MFCPIFFTQILVEATTTTGATTTAPIATTATGATALVLPTTTISALARASATIIGQYILDLIFFSPFLKCK